MPNNESATPEIIPEGLFVVLVEMAQEYQRARVKFPPFHSAHEGYAIIKEELDELWGYVKANQVFRSRKEAVQVGAMAIAFIMEASITRVEGK